MNAEFTHKGSYAHVPGYAEINFQQGLDGDDWELDLAASKAQGRGLLIYRRGEEWASVPNIHYNQPATWRVEALRWQADRCDERAARQDELARDPFMHHHAAHNRKQAISLRNEAERLAREGNGKTIAADLPVEGEAA